MGVIDEVIAEMKKQRGKHYRMVSLTPDNVSMKKVKGYEFVRKEDPEVKGTALEKHVRPDGLITIGNLALARTSEEQYRRNRAKVAEMTERRLRGIKESHLRGGEDIKRKLGKRHGDFRTIHETEE